MSEHVMIAIVLLIVLLMVGIHVPDAFYYTTI